VRSINLLILIGIRKNCLRSVRSRSLYLSIRRVIKQTAIIIGAYHFCQLRTNCIQHPAVKVDSLSEEIIGDHQCGFQRNRPATDRILRVRHEKEKNWNTMKQCTIHL